jgi:dihydrofolate reductase
MLFNLIVAIHEETFGIDLIWPRLSEDMKHFVNKTKGQYIICGTKTWTTLPKKLANRTCVVLTRGTSAPKAQNGDVPDLIVNSVKQLDALKTFMVIGGGEIYRYFIENHLDEIQNMYITYVRAKCGSIYYIFPKIRYR